MGSINRGAKAAGGTAFAGGTTALASEVNTDFDNIYNEFNSNISNVNIATAAAILGTKLAGDAASAAAAQVSEDPFPLQVFMSRANLTEEVRSLRFVIEQAFGHSSALDKFWYTDAVMFSTGDCKVTLKTTADPGWVLMDTDDGTIGNVASSGTKRANVDTEELFELLWNNENIANTGTITNISRNGGNITAISIANPSVITTVNHGLSDGDVIEIHETDAQPRINGVRTITRISDDTFSVPVDVTEATEGGLGFWHQVGHIPATRAIIVDAAHGLSTGDIILIDGDDATPSIDGVHTVERVSANAFAINVTVTVNGTTGTWIRNFIQNSAGTIVDKSLDADAQIAFDANRRIVLPVALGRALAISGAGGSVRGDDLTLTSRPLLGVEGNEAHTLSIEQMPVHSHDISASHFEQDIRPFFDRGLNLRELSRTSQTGGDASHNNVQPSFFVNVMIKL